MCIDGEQDAEQLERLRAFAKAGQANGSSKIFVQISHAGRQSNGTVNMSPVGPGDVRLELPKAVFGTPRALTVTEINEIKQKFVYAAKVCQECGFDGVQLHSAHGYLLSSFLNPRANNREKLFGDGDNYGGSLENRSRLLIEIVRDVRSAVGGGFPIAVKLNSADFQEGGFTSEEAVEVSCLLDKEGIDLLEISGGNYESSIFEDAVAAVEESGKGISTKKREAYFLVYAAEVLKAVRKVPVMVTGGWRTRSTMEGAIIANECDMLGLGRPLCGDPDGPLKLLEQSIDFLPTYEKELRTGHWSLQWIYYFPFSLLKLLQLVGQMGWYYMNIVDLSETGVASVHNRGCFASYVSNTRREYNLAVNMKGNVQCKGSVYKGTK